MKKTGKYTVSGGAAILIGATIPVILMAAIFKIAITDMLGSVGRGYFSAAYEIFTPVFAVAVAGLPVAVSRMVAENAALGKYRDVRVIFRIALRLFAAVGVAVTLLMLILAFPYVKFIADSSSLTAVLCIIPCVFFCCVTSVYRGYYEGLENMVPTAVSQVVEEAVKLIFGLLFVKLFQNHGLAVFNAGMSASGSKSAVVYGVTVTNLTEANGTIAPYSAAGAVLGVTLGSFAAMLFLVLRMRLKGSGITRNQLVSSPRAQQGSSIAPELVKIAVPVVLTALVLNITNLIDTATIQARLTSALKSEEGFNYITEMFSKAFALASSGERLNLSDRTEVAKYLWGAYGTALDFKNLVPTITVQLGISALPALAAAWAVRNKGEVRATVTNVLRITTLTAMPAGIGLASLATPILTLIYGRGSGSDSISVIAPIMIVYGFSTFIIALLAPLTNMLQAVGRTDIPVKSVIAATVVKLISNIVLVGMYRLNIYGALIGTVLFYLIAVGIDFIYLIKVTGTSVNWLSSFIKPLGCALFCGVTAFSAYSLLSMVIPDFNSGSVFCGNTLSTLIAILFGVLSYTVSLIFVKGIEKEDLEAVGKGGKIAKRLEKYGLLG